MTKYERGLITLLFILALFASFFFVENYNLKKELSKKINIIEEEINKENLKKIAELKNKINNLSLEAKAISIYDITKKEKIYGKNDDVVLPLASLAKTMTIISVLNDNYEGEVMISPNAIKESGDYGLYKNEKWKITDLAKFSLILSSNDGALALSSYDKDFLNKINNKAGEIGMKNTFFSNSTGLDINKEKAGAYGTSLDANTLAIYALKTYPEIFEATTMSNVTLKSLSDFTHKIKNTNTITNKIPNLLFSKTGFTELAGGNLSIIFKDKEGHEIAVTVLGSSVLGRFTDVEKLVNVIYNENNNIQ